MLNLHKMCYHDLCTQYISQCDSIKDEDQACLLSRRVSVSCILIAPSKFPKNTTCFLLQHPI